MNSTLKKYLIALVLAGVAVAVGWTWRSLAERRRWDRLRPDMPPVGNVSPELARRLTAAHRGLDRWPPDRAALAEFTRLCHANGLLPPAMAGYRALGVLDPQDAHWPHLLASILAGYGRLDEALPLLRRTVELAPDYLAARLRLGDALFKADATAEARNVYDEALRRFPGNPYALLGLARCDLQQERWTSARSRLQQVVAGDPRSADALSLLATVQERLGNAAAAAAARDRVADAFYAEAPDPWTDELTGWCLDPYLLLTAASAAIADGTPARSLPLLARAQVLAPDDPRIHRQLAKAMSRLGDPVRAQAELERAVNLAPHDDALRLDLVTFLETTHDRDAVAKAVAAGVAACPGSAALQYAAGRIAAEEGRLEEAAENFRLAWQYEPDKPAAAHELAQVYFRLARPDDGIAVLQDLLRRAPRDTAAHVLLVEHGIDAGDRRTEGWLEQARAAGLGDEPLHQLERAYRRRFNPGIQ